MSELLFKTPIEDMSKLEVEINLGLKLLEIFEKYNIILSKEGKAYKTHDGRLFYKDRLIAYTGSDRTLLSILCDEGCNRIHERHNELMQLISSLKV
jgi:hypothetical protein